MSRIGKQPITVPAGVEVKIGTDVVEVKGPKGTLHTPVCSLLNYDLTDGVLTLTRVEDDRHSRAQHGLRRTLLANCIEGVTKGFSKSLEVIGVGYRVAVKGNLVELSVGFSHPVLVELPEGIQAKAEGQILTISGADKELVGEMAAKILKGEATASEMDYETITEYGIYINSDALAAMGITVPQEIADRAIESTAE